MHGVVSWVAALTSLIGFALAIGIHPALYGATADMLARGGSIARPLTWMLSGLAVGATSMFAALHLFNPTRFLTGLRLQIEHEIVTRWVDLTAGIIFLVLAAATLGWRLKQPRLPAHTTTAPTQFTGPGVGYAYFGVGASSAVIGFTTWPIMYLVTRIVGSVSHDMVLRGIAFGVFLVALVSPFLLLSWTWAKFPVSNSKLTQAYTRVLAADYRFAIAVLFAVAGLIFLALVVLRPAAS